MYQNTTPAAVVCKALAVWRHKWPFTVKPMSMRFHIFLLFQIWVSAQRLSAKRSNNPSARAAFCSRIWNCSERQFMFFLSLRMKGNGIGSFWAFLLMRRYPLKFTSSTWPENRIKLGLCCKLRKDVTFPFELKRSQTFQSPLYLFSSLMLRFTHDLIRFPFW